MYLYKGSGLLSEGHEVSGQQREPCSSVGFSKLGALHHILYLGYTTAGLCSTVPQSSGAGDIHIYTHFFDYILYDAGLCLYVLWEHVLYSVGFVSGREGSDGGYDEVSAIL